MTILNPRFDNRLRDVTITDIYMTVDYNIMLQVIIKKVGTMLTSIAPESIKRWAGVQYQPEADIAITWSA